VGKLRPKTFLDTVNLRGTVVFTTIFKGEALTIKFIFLQEHNQIMRLKIDQKTLKNGLKIFHVKVPTEDVTILYSVNAGPILESKSNAGISHLIEHMLFKGTKKRVSRDEIYNEIRLLGEELFCHTNYTHIPLGMRVVKADFDKTLDLLSDLVFNSSMNSNEIKKEKKVVLDEIRNRQDDPYIHIWEELNSLCFNGTALEKPIIGFPKSVLDLSDPQVLAFYKKLFRPSNTILITVGPFTFSEIVKKVDSALASTVSSKKITLSSIKLRPNTITEKKIKRKLDNIHLLAGQIVPIQNISDSVALDIATGVLSRSVFNKLVNEKAISYNGWAYYYTLRSFGVIAMYATAQKKNLKMLRKVIKYEYSKFVQGNIDPNHVNDIVESKKKSFILKHSNTMEKAKLLLDCYLQGNINNINLIAAEYSNTDLKKTQKVVKKYLDSKKLTSVSIGNL